jgi:hypothetical protein
VASLIFLSRISNQSEKYIGVFEGAAGATLAVIRPGDSAEVLTHDDVTVTMRLLETPDAEFELEKLAGRVESGDHHAA